MFGSFKPRRFITLQDTKLPNGCYKSAVLIILVVAIALILIFVLPGNWFHKKVLISYWANYADNIVGYPVPGSFKDNGQLRANDDMQTKLDAIDILIYGFLHLNAKGELHFDNSYVDLSVADNAFCRANPTICADNNGKYNPKLGNFTAFTHLKNSSGKLMKLISVGGGNDPLSLDYAISHPDKFIHSVITIIDYYQLDGVDLDFEPNSFTPQQELSYEALVLALREKLGPKRLIIITLNPYQILKQHYLQLLVDRVNFFNAMCYNFHMPYYPPYYTGYSSNLYLDDKEPEISNYLHISCDQAIQRLVAAKIPPKKIVLGYPSYALAYGGVANKNTGLFQPFDPNKTPAFNSDIVDKGAVPYKNIPALLASGFHEYAAYYNGHINAVWAYNPATQQFLAYDNLQLVREKANYVNQNRLAGLMTWMISYDLPFADEKSLLKAAKTAL